MKYIINTLLFFSIFLLSSCNTVSELEAESKEEVKVKNQKASLDIQNLDNSEEKTEKGVCYAYSYLNNKYNKKQEKYLAKDSSTSYKVNENQFETTLLKKMTKPEDKILTQISAVFEDVSKEIETEQSYTKLKIKNIVFKNVKDQWKSQESYENYELIPATFKNVDHKILIKEAYQKLEVIPPTFSYVDEKILIKDGYLKLNPTQTSYDSKTIKIEVQPEYEKIEVIQPIYKTVIEKIVIKDAAQRWKTSPVRNCKSTEPEDCVRRCLINMPAVTKDIKKQMIDQQASVKRTIVPAKYKEVLVKEIVESPKVLEEKISPEFYSYTKKIIKTPSSIKKIDIKPIYQDVVMKVIDKPAEVKKFIEPAVFNEYEKQVVDQIETVVEEQVPSKIENVIYKRKTINSNIKEELIPAVQVEIEQKKLTTPSSTNVVQIQPEFITYNKDELDPISLTSVKTEVLCNSKINSDITNQIDTKLSQLGYKTGGDLNINRNLGDKTIEALNKFQSENNLPVGQVSLESLNLLGVKYE